eukprot:6168471-Prymnesium_polylepis.1
MPLRVMGTDGPVVSTPVIGVTTVVPVMVFGCSAPGSTGTDSATPQPTITGLEISSGRYITLNETVKRFHKKTLPFAQEPAAPGGS